MSGISQNTWNELRRFVRTEAPLEDEPDGDEMGGAPSMDGGPPGAVAIEVKSEPEGAGKTCPTCGQHMP